MAEIDSELSTVIQMVVTWKIRKFWDIPAKLNSRLESAPFPLAGSIWRLELYPNGRTQFSSAGHIDILLIRLNFSVAQQEINATFSLQNYEGKIYNSFDHNYFYKENLDRREVIRFIARSQLRESSHNLQDGALVVHCRIIIESPSHDNVASKDESSQTDTLAAHCQVSVESSSDDSGACEDESSETDSSETGSSPRPHLDASSQTETLDACKGDGDLPRTSPSVQTLQTDYRKLLESKEDSDVCLKVSDKEFRAHKCILRARSSVFSAMFEHDMEEKTGNKVVIEDMDPESFPDLLQHLYSGCIDEISEQNVFNLFTAADKYDLTDLKSECKNRMKSTLSVDTFCDVMIVALRYREDDLLKPAVEFIAKNLKKIIVTVKWQKFLKEYDTEANELFIKALVTDDEE